MTYCILKFKETNTRKEDIFDLYIYTPGLPTKVVEEVVYNYYSVDGVMTGQILILQAKREEDEKRKPLYLLPIAYITIELHERG